MENQVISPEVLAALEEAAKGGVPSVTGNARIFQEIQQEEETQNAGRESLQS